MSRPAVLTLVAFSLVATLASADHLGTYDAAPDCLSAEGRHVHADCDLERDLYLYVWTPKGAKPAETGAGVDTARGVPTGSGPAEAGPLEAASKEALLAVRATTGPADAAFVPVEAAERDAKRDLYHGLESTGLHFRLVCGWDVSQTARTCATYDPERDAETAKAREMRDLAAERGHSAVAASASELARDHAPAADLRVAVKRVAVRVDTVPPSAPSADVSRNAADVPLLPSGEVRESSAPVPLRFDAPASPAPDGASLAAPEPSEASPARALAAPESRALAKAASPGAERDGLIVLAIGAGAGALLFALGALAHRYLQGSDLLANRHRRALYLRVKEQPGSTITDLAESAGVRHSTATHHLQVLEESGLVVAERVGNKKHYFGNGDIGNHRSRLHAVLPRMGRASELVSALARLGSARPAELARATGLSVAGVHWHLDRLERLAVVAGEPDGSGRRFRLAEPAASRL